MTAYIQSAGQPLRVNGFAALFNTPIEVDGKTEIIAPGAFSATLRSGASAVRALVSHDPTTAWASVKDGSLKIWQDSVGLAFSAKLEDTVAGRQLARSVASGNAGASFRFKPLETQATASGYIVTDAMLYEISILGEPAYSTAAWLSDPDLMDGLPDHAVALRRLWAEPRPAATPRPATRRSQVRAMPRRRAPVVVAVTDVYPTIAGLSSRELEEAALQDASCRRMQRDAEARRFAQQRERNRAIRKAMPA